jgi:hypothetical protein
MIPFKLPLVATWYGKPRGYFTAYWLLFIKDDSWELTLTVYSVRNQSKLERIPDTKANLLNRRLHAIDRTAKDLYGSL